MLHRNKKKEAAMPVTTKLKGNDVAFYGNQVNLDDEAPSFYCNFTKHCLWRSKNRWGSRCGLTYYCSSESWYSCLCNWNKKIQWRGCKSRKRCSLCGINGFIFCIKKILFNRRCWKSSGFKRLQRKMFFNFLLEL